MDDLICRVGKPPSLHLNTLFYSALFESTEGSCLRRHLSCVYVIVICSDGKWFLVNRTQIEKNWKARHSWVSRSLTSKFVFFFVPSTNISSPVGKIKRGLKWGGILVFLRTLRNVYGVGSPTIGPISSSVRLHIYVHAAVTYITEISLHVTFCNQSHSLALLFRSLKSDVIQFVISISKCNCIKQVLNTVMWTLKFNVWWIVFEAMSSALCGKDIKIVIIIFNFRAMFIVSS